MKNKVICWYLYLISICIFVLLIPNILSIDIFNYCFLLFSYVIVKGFFLHVVTKFKIDIFDPFVTITLLSIAIYSIAPMIYIIIDDTSCYGIYVMDGCIKGTILYLLGYTGFVIGYFNRGIIINSAPFKFNQNSMNNNLIILLSLLGWGICYLLNIFYVFASGKNLKYLLSFGTSGSVTESILSDTPLKFIGNFGFCLVTYCLYIYVYSKNKLLKYCVYILTIMLFFINGYRFIIVALILCLTTYYYLSQRKRPSIKTLSFAFIVFLIFITVMGEIRGDVRSGVGSTLNNVSLDSFFTAFDSNFNIYKTYYAIVAHVPKDMPYTYGQAIFSDTLEIVIPRILWPGKPAAGSGALLSRLIKFGGKGTIKAAMSTPYLTEIYVDFGFFGVMVIMYVIGILLSKSTKMYKNNLDNTHQLIMYCVIFSFLFQFLIRGYFPNNFWMLIFALLPILINRYLKIL